MDTVCEVWCLVIAGSSRHVHLYQFDRRLESSVRSLILRITGSRKMGRAGSWYCDDSSLEIDELDGSMLSL